MPWYAVFRDPTPGGKGLIKGFLWTLTGVQVSLKITHFHVRCTAIDSAPHTPASIEIALTKTGNLVAATPFHSFHLTADGVDYDLASAGFNCDFSSEVAISAEEAASGLVGLIIDWSDAFVGCMVEIGDITLELCQGSGGGTPVAMGLGYGDLGGDDEYLGVVSGALYAQDGDYLPEASGYNWSPNLAAQYALSGGKWQIWQCFGEEFLTMPSQGVFRRPVSATFDEQIKPLYQDYVHPGRDGAGRAQVSNPPYNDHVFDHTLDTAVIVTSALTSGLVIATTGIDVASNKPTLHITGQGGWGNGYAEFEIDLGAALDMNTAPSMWPYLMLHFITSKTLNGSGTFADSDNSNFGFTADITRYQVNFADSSGFTAGHQSGYLQAARIMGISGSTQRDMFAFFDLQGLVGPSGSLGAVMGAVRKVRVRVGLRGGTSCYVRLDEFQQLGTYYHRFSPSKLLQNADPALDGALEYAFSYTQTGISGQATNATAFNVPASLHLGAKPTTPEPALETLMASVPFGGSSLNLTIPQAPSPFDTSAKINIYRKVGPFWRRIFQSADNSDTYNVTDYYPDEYLYYNLALFPQATLNFNAIGPEGSGQATGIINGTEFAGVNAYAHENGKVYFSQSNNAQIVEWEGIVVDNPSDALFAPRSFYVSGTHNPVLVMVPMSTNLYMFTRKDGYVMVIPPGGTPATASFPASIAGVRGAMGVRAACRYLQGALFGSDDSLWYVEKWDTQTDIPDKLQEVTIQNRGLWALLIGDGDSRENLIVRQVAGDIWCFCENRFIFISRDGNVVYGEWMDGGFVEDAYGDPKRGMVLQFSDGSLAVTGRFVTDRGTNLAGDNGAVISPAWTRRSKRFTKPFDLKKVRLVYENSSGGLSTPAVRALAFSQRGDPAGNGIDFADGTLLHGMKPFDEGSEFSGKPGGQWWEIEIQGSNYDTVTAALIVGAAASPEPTR